MNTLYLVINQLTVESGQYSIQMKQI